MTRTTGRSFSLSAASNCVADKNEPSAKAASLETGIRKFIFMPFWMESIWSLKGQKWQIQAVDTHTNKRGQIARKQNVLL
jgi:hypothetical protein